MLDDLDHSLFAIRGVAASRWRDHPMAKQRKTTWRERAQYDTIAVSKTSGNRLLLDQALAHVPVRTQSILLN